MASRSAAWDAFGPPGTLSILDGQMQNGDGPTGKALDDAVVSDIRQDAIVGPARSAISVALLAGVAFVPIVVAVGFLTDRPAPPSVPGDISVLALRGVFDTTAGPRPALPARAGY